MNEGKPDVKKAPTEEYMRNKFVVFDVPILLLLLSKNIPWCRKHPTIRPYVSKISQTTIKVN
jgi:hypothetical protein